MIATQPSVEIVAREGNPVLCLRGALGVGDASALRAAATRFARPPAAAAPEATGPEAAGTAAAGLSQIDIGELASLDVSVMQILAALGAEFARQGRRLEMPGASQAVRRQWESAGWPGFAPAPGVTVG